MGNKTCSLCPDKHYAKGYCRMHYARYMKHGDATVTLKAGPGKATTGLHSSGYVLVYQQYDHPNSHGNGRIFEHILVMSQILGRPLLPSENVHHKNGIRSDNRSENLELWIKHQPAGQRTEDLIEWARQMLGRYGTQEERATYGSTEED